MIYSKEIAPSGNGFRAFLAIILIAACALPPFAFSQTSEVEKAFHQGAEALRNGQLDAASADFSKVIALSPAFAEAHFDLGLVRLQQGDFDGAVVRSKGASLRAQTARSQSFFGNRPLPQE